MSRTLLNIQYRGPFERQLTALRLQRSGIPLYSKDFRKQTVATEQNSFHLVIHLGLFCTAFRNARLSSRPLPQSQNDSTKQRNSTETSRSRPIKVAKNNARADRQKIKEIAPRSTQKVKQASDAQQDRVLEYIQDVYQSSSGSTVTHFTYLHCRDRKCTLVQQSSDLSTLHSSIQIKSSDSAVNCSSQLGNFMRSFLLAGWRV